MKKFFLNKKNIILASVVVAVTAILAWSFIELFKAAEYQQAMYGTPSGEEEYGGGLGTEVVPAEEEQIPAVKK